MSSNTTIARPYAKAAFTYALNEKSLKEWSNDLQVLTQLITDPLLTKFINNPSTTTEKHSELIKQLLSNLPIQNANGSLQNFVNTLAENKRLLIIPQISVLFDAMRAEYEKTLNVDVISYSELSSKQQQHLVDSLNKRLQRQVALNIVIDKNLLGGAIINAGGLIIDGSVRSKLSKLRAVLAA